MSAQRRRWTVKQLAAAIAEERSLAGVLRRLGLRPAGGNYENVGRVITENRLCTSHFTGRGHLRGRHNPHAPKTPLEQVLVSGSIFQSNQLRKRLVAESVLPAKCSICLRTDWIGSPIPLELDHVDGDRHNNRIENLRLLCPNCHALTPTYRGRNVRLRRQAMR
jgi:5-methylcytosine-specific restriction endonuclease McrA